MIEVDPMSIDQLAGAVVLFLGSVGSLLLVVWQSKCHCKVNLCYIFQCERRPPNEEEMKSLKDQAKQIKDKQDKMSKKEDKILKEEKVIQKDVEALVPVKSQEKNLDVVFSTPRAEKDELNDLT